MSKLWVRLDYNVASATIKSLKEWLGKLEDMLDEAARNNGKETHETEKEESC